MFSLRIACLVAIRKCLWLPVLFVFFLTLPGLGQTVIQGTVQEAGGAPLPFATVVLLQATDSSLIKGTVCSQNGDFRFESVQPGQYQLAASLLGYRQTYSRILAVNAHDGQMTTQVLVLPAEVHQLQEVRVQASTPLFEQQPDRLVVNVGSSITAAGATVLDVLERSPGIGVNRQHNSLSLNGRQGVLVMINGKPSRLPPEAIVQMLAAMNATNLEKIELITTPPAGFDAEGNAGIINLVLKKNVEYGTSGNYSLTGGYGRYEKGAASLSFTHRTRKLNLYGDYSVLRDHAWWQMRVERTSATPSQATRIHTVNDWDLLWLNHNAQVGLDYQAGDNTVIGAVVSGFRNKPTIHSLNRTEIQTKEQRTGWIEMDRNEVNTWKHALANLYLRHTFEKKHSVSVDADYLFFENRNPHQYFLSQPSRETFPDLPGQIRNRKVTPIRMGVFKADYSYAPNAQTKLETGVKGLLSGLDNSVRVETERQGTWTTDPELTQLVTMREDIGAAYFNLKREFAQQVSLQAGLRYEYTYTDLSKPGRPSFVHRRYGNWFPGVSLSKSFPGKDRLSFSYSRRITRPTYGNLAPYVAFADPFTVFEGNTNLKPALTDALQLSYQYKERYLVLVGYGLERNAIASFQVRSDLSDNRQYYYPENIRRIQTYSATFSLPFAVTPWWEMQKQLLSVWQVTRTEYQQLPVRLINRYLRANTTQTFTLPAAFSMEISGFYQTRSLQGIFKQAAFGSCTVGVQKKLNGEGGTLKLSVQDVFWNNRLQYAARYPALGLDSQFGFLFEPRVVRLTYSNRFGNRNVKAARRSTGSEEERKRAQ